MTEPIPDANDLIASVEEIHAALVKHELEVIRLRELLVLARRLEHRRAETSPPPEALP